MASRGELSRIGERSTNPTLPLDTSGALNDQAQCHSYADRTKGTQLCRPYSRVDSRDCDGGIPTPIPSLARYEHIRMHRHGVAK